MRSGETVWRGALEVLPDAAAVGEAAARRVLDAVTRARSRGREPVLGWPVGRTPLPVVAALARAGTDLADLHVVLMDDYVVGGQRVPEDEPVSCRAAAMRELLDPLVAALGPGRAPSVERLHSPDPANPAATERQIVALGGVDVFLVAVGGSDGHVALNPPGTPADSRTRLVDVAESTRRDNVGTWGLDSLADVPERGVSVGLATIADAHRIVVVAHGAGKRHVVRRLLDGTAFDPGLPASIVRGHPQLAVLVDDAAAASLTGGARA